MKIDRISEWHLTAADEAAIAALLESAFDVGFGGRTFYKQRHHLRLVMRDGDAVVGHMALCYRAVRLGGRLVDIVGLAEVATDPARQGQGVASRLLPEAIAAARETRAEFLLLFGDRPLYAGAGFVAFPDNPMRWTGMDGAATGETCTGVSETLMVLPLAGAAWDGAADLDLMGPLF
ncbi:GNAT family N-acetyltransferase [Wenxinia marina]|uniref:Putative acetyltransferase n=1 Tax=Wenxinia marina DSM 24838 TaxID=1123501 RepID=A0A0D0NSB1_9RHOB|nr:GNAT family N-acetyltransferase [Wenxinia marina]KIQ71110.1 putative acetyltransferase [Wenxinia marina DSM 24838]GGL54755.1 hypothetical protein GCM10011392_06470 [Wenxinia marina]